VLVVGKQDIYELVALCRHGQSLIPFKLISKKFHNDLNAFLFGQTLVKRDNEIMIYKHDYIAWLRKIYFKGFEKPIDLHVE